VESLALSFRKVPPNPGLTTDEGQANDRDTMGCGLLALAACGPIVDYHPPELDPATSIIHEGHSCNG
jgi:hypothetical protein